MTTAVLDKLAEQHPDEQREAEVLRQAKEEAERGFDLGAGPLMRARLLRLSSDEHVLLITIHHIVFDGWSLRVLFRELSALYAAYSAGRESPLAELPIQYGDFAAWQRERMTGVRLSEQISYWKHRLEGAPAVLELPGDRPRPAARTPRGGRFDFAISRHLTDKLAAIGRREQATLFMTLLAAFATLLFRYTEEEDILIGSPIAGREREETEALIGLFVNTLVFRTDLSGNPSFRGLLRRVRESALGAYSHQELPFERLVEELKPSRSRAHAPIFQVLFSLQNFQSVAPEKARRLGDLTMTPLRTDRGISRFDLELEVAERAHGLACLFDYSEDLFDAATIGRMTENFRTLLEGIAADPDRSLWDLPLLAPEERRRVLVQWNETEAPYPRGETIQGMFERQAANTPRAIALESAGEQLTYEDVNRRANRLAVRLRDMGVGPEILVGVYAERSVEAVVGMLATLKAGGAYLPLDPAYPRERLQFLLEDSSASIVLTQRQWAAELPEISARAHGVPLEPEAGDLSESSENPERLGGATNLAYVIYTSGSTGQPKGVEVTHRGFVNHALAVGKDYGLVPGDRVLQFTSLAFDVAAEEIFPTWLAGATVVLRPEAVGADIAEFLRFVEQEGITVVNLPASFWHQWVEQLSHIRSVPPSLRLVVTGSERVLPASLGVWREHAGTQVGWRNAYGPTEATITATLYCLDSGNPPEGSASVPIGRPIANTRTYVLDRALRPVPVGAPGELYLGGDGLARGYRNRPDQTAESFIASPFDDAPGARLYKTGDRVRWRSDGNLEFVGRRDDQVKIRGYRVEPGEIEAVLERHPAIRESVVLGRTDGSGAQRLVAFLVPQSGVELDVPGVRAFIRGALPEHMVPSSYAFLPALPRTPGGKIDRAALPDPDFDRRQLAEDFVAPATATERVLAGIWAEVLRIEKVGIHDDFFELGGHSLLAMQVFSRLRDAFPAGLPLRALFDSPTVAALAAAVDAAQKAGSERSPSRIPAVSRDALLRGHAAGGAPADTPEKSG